MAAIDQIITRDLVARELIKRKNWAAREPGVMVVFCIVFVGTLPPTLLIQPPASTQLDAG